MTSKPLNEIYMHTATGRKYYPFDPKIKDVNIETIAHHLATIGRWNGATLRKGENGQADRIFYSVAEHSVYVYRYVKFILERPDLALCALLHDAAEAYVSDLIRPLKYSPVFSKPFREVENINEQVIAEKFNLPYPFPKQVKEADEAVCAAEAEQIVVKCASEDWSVGKCHDDSVIAPYFIEMLDPTQARDLFLATFYEEMRLLGR